MRAASIGEPPEVPTEVLKWSSPVWNSGVVPGEAGQSGTVEKSQEEHTVQQQESQVRYMRNIHIKKCTG